MLVDEVDGPAFETECRRSATEAEGPEGVKYETSEAFEVSFVEKIPIWVSELTLCISLEEQDTEDLSLFSDFLTESGLETSADPGTGYESQDFISVVDLSVGGFGDLG